MRSLRLRFTFLALTLTGLLLTVAVGCGDDDNPLTSDRTPPTVNANVSPANNAINVPLNTILTASFNEAMTVSTVSASSFTLRHGSISDVGAVTFSNALGASFSPNNLLLANTVYFATISTGAEDLAGNGLASNYTWTFTTGSSIDATPPFVASTLPPNGATQVALNSAITAFFSEALNPTTVNATSFLVNRGATAITGSVSYSGNAAIFTPTVALSPGTVYTVTIATTVTDLAGNRIVLPKVWSFTTAASTDGLAPTVVFTIPSNTASAVSVGANLSATFSEAMNASSISATTFTLRQGSVSVPGTVTYSGLVATFNPTSDLTANVEYTASITTGVRDVAGNALAAAYTWTFNTSSNPDQSAPTVIATSPTNGAVNVALASNVIAVFSEPMNAPSVSNATFTLMQGSVQYEGVVSYSGTTMTFNPTSDLAPGVTYIATLFTGVTDLAGNALGSNYVWNFTTVVPVPPPDVNPPSVFYTHPSSNATFVATGTIVSASFSETIDPASVNASTFILRQGSTPIAGTVEAFRTAVGFTPSAALLPQTVYTATLTTGIKDLAGNALASNYVWSFTTGTEVGTDVPLVISVTPENLAVDVLTIGNLTATFSEAMNPSSVNTTTFKLSDANGSVAGTVTMSGRTATFTPFSRLLPNTLYNGTITTGVRNGGGNGLAIDYEWVFVTEAVPEVTGVVPTVDGFGVPITGKVAASFTKPVNPNTVNTSTFVVRQGGNVVPGTVSTVGPAVVFDPTGNFSPNTTYTATITTDVTDLSGNHLAMPYTWSFSTGSAVDGSAPTVTASSPASGETNVPRGGVIQVYFSEPIDPTTLTTTSFTVRAGSNHAVGVVSYPETIGIFTPSVLLAPNTVYTVTITTALKDISGNALASQKTWTFTTRP